MLDEMPRPIQERKAQVTKPKRKRQIKPSGLTTIAIPRIGDYWPGQGGILHGIMAGQDGKPDYLLISAEKKHHHAAAGFTDMQEYPKTLTVDGHKDFSMPTRKEQRVQFANAKPGQFDAEWYWSCEQFALDSAYAWFQHFGTGSQNYWHKDNQFRGCVARRIPILRGSK